jgi:N-acetylmuramoyl-L-alanine amidase
MLRAARLLRAFCSRSRMPPAWQARAVSRLACGAILLSTLAAHAGSRLPPFERAERLRAALEASPESERTAPAYKRVLDAYRAIYHDNPASPKADASVLAVAELLTEEGRLFSNEELLHDAIGQYEFLRLQYPASRYRFSALITEGEIYRRDLADRDAAKERFQQFLKVYPLSPLTEQARVELTEIHQEEYPSSRQAHHGSTRPAAPAHSGRNAVLAAAIESQQPTPPSRPAAATTAPAMQPQQAPAPSRLAPPAIQQPPQAQLASLPEEASPAPFQALHPGQVALVSGIRHWSTPVYTRIAIDLQDQVAYQAARVPGPDRIYFDLYGARLEPALNGKSVEVIDDGFLKRIRAAQFSNNVTRVVLDVSSVSDYSAFLLPNPWRLIIDIHGLKPGATPTTNLASLPPIVAPRNQNQGSIAPLGQPARAAAVPSVSGPPAVTNPRPNTTPANASAGRSAAGSTQEIATLGQQPNRVQATDRPTTHPIAASVAGTVPAPQADDGSLASTTGASTTGASTTPVSTTPPPVTSRKKPSAMHPAAPSLAENDDNLSAPMREAAPTAAGERSLVRTLGLKIGRIVIDAGHGGHDSGTVGPGGIEEKQVVLDVALRLGKLLKQRLGADVIYTRDNDTFIPLETRTAIANKAQADLFLSIHANSSPDSSARGVETYYLNFTTSPDALEVAARENAVSDESIHELSDLVKKITLKDKIDESREFAADVQKSLYDNLEDGNPGLRDRGIKKAPFVVLIGANMPSILAEISFLTNTDDARQLQQPAYRQRIAESLYRGVERYISGLSGVRLAQSAGRPTGN